MGIFKRAMYRFDKEEIAGWSSLQKTSYLLLPLLIYLLVHDMAEIVLWAVLDIFLQMSSTALQEVFVQQAATVQGVINALALLAGMAAIGSGIKGELAGEYKRCIQKAAEGNIKAGKPKKETPKQPEKGIAEAACKKGLNGSRITEYFGLLVLAFLSAVGINILFYQIGFMQSSAGFQKVHEAQFGVTFWIGLVLFGLLSPIAEEAVFRGILYNRLKRCFSYKVALLTSALLFGCYHGNVVQAVYGAVLGLLIAYTYEVFESFAAPVIFHSAANISVYVMTYHKSWNGPDRPAALALSIGMLAAAAGIVVWLGKRKKNLN